MRSRRLPLVRPPEPYKWQRLPGWPELPTGVAMIERQRLAVRRGKQMRYETALAGKPLAADEVPPEPRLVNMNIKIAPGKEKTGAALL